VVVIERKKGRKNRGGGIICTLHKTVFGTLNPRRWDELGI
jgi:hypothetical protein